MTVLFLHENFNLQIDAEIFPMSILLARHFGIFLHFMIENLDDFKELSKLQILILNFFYVPCVYISLFMYMLLNTSDIISIVGHQAI